MAAEQTITVKREGGEQPINVQREVIKISKGGGTVDSVNGKTGDVILTAQDVGALPDTTVIPSKTSQLTNDSDFATETFVTNAVGAETESRIGADNGLQNQIDALAASSDVTDIVGTYSDLENYDTSKLNDNDIIKVLQDETQNDKTTYYRWDKHTETFSLIGEEGPYYTKSAADQKFQDKLTAGSNITIDANNEISATDTTYSAGSGLTLSDTEFSVDTTTIQPKLTAGSNISISGDTISATDTTYSDFTGTDGVDAGTAGLVPAPATTDAGKYLKADGTWDTVNAGPTVVQTTGTSTTDVMSQVATSQLIYPSGQINKTNRDISIGDNIYAAYPNWEHGSVMIGHEVFNNGMDQCVAIGYNAIVSGTPNYTVALGRCATTTKDRSVAVGPNAEAVNGNSVALGDHSVTSRRYEVSIGSGQAGDASTYKERYLANVKDPSLAQDAATKNYVDSFYPVGTVYSSTSSTAPTFVGGTWTQIGSQTIGSSTVYYYERTA